MNGWIKISRGISTHWLWQDAERLKWWLDLLFMAQWKDKQVLHDAHLFTLRKGQLIASISFLVDRWQRSRPTIIKFLKRLEDEGKVKRITLYRQTAIITICNYDSYQSSIDTIVDNPLYSLNQSSTNKNIDTLVDTITNYASNDCNTHGNKQINTMIDTIIDTLVDTKQRIEEREEYSSSSSTNARARNFFGELKADRIWGEAMAMNFNLTSLAELHEWIDKFELDCNCREVTHTDRKDAKRHFNDWLRIKKYSSKQKATTKNQPQTTTSYNPEDEYNRRQAEFAKHIEEQLRTPYREIDVSQIF